MRGLHAVLFVLLATECLAGGEALQLQGRVQFQRGTRRLSVLRSPNETIGRGADGALVQVDTATGSTITT